LHFTTSYEQALQDAEVVFIAVGTPPDEDGSADLKHVLAAAKEIGRVMQKPLVIVDKSTVPVGTADKVRRAVASALQDRGVEITFHVVSNPEFLKEGAAIEDFMKPDRIVVGCEHPESVAVMQRLYAPFCRNHDRLIVMGVKSAELTKYAANAMLATRISFMNELANLADAVGADIEAVRRGIGSDSRIGPNFLYAGVGYGGSCFPKDVQALIRTARDHNVSLRVVSAVEQANEYQKTVLVEKIRQHFDGALEGKTVALWGLAFKANTDDLREASSQVLIRALTAEGCTVQAYDPVAGKVARVLFADNSRVRILGSADEVIVSADALAVVTEWKEFHSPDFTQLARKLKNKPLFDGRNLYDPDEVRQAGMIYYGIGRGADPKRNA
jgi:UDPglucose 6-dehydrogenase